VRRGVLLAFIGKAMHLDRALASRSAGDEVSSLVLWDALLERFLRVQPDRYFCVPCLARMISAPLEDARVAAERLRTPRGLAAATRQCSNCDESRPALGYSL